MNKDRNARVVTNHLYISMCAVHSLPSELNEDCGEKGGRIERKESHADVLYGTTIGTWLA